MCELFVMSSRVPANVRFSFEEFSRHGGLAGSHKDGWGIAWYVDEDVRLVKEPEPASDSACVRFVQDHPFASQLVVSHIRTATRGRPTLKNCQPFVRELGGRQHVFAHNGASTQLDSRRGSRSRVSVPLATPIRNMRSARCSTNYASRGFAASVHHFPSEFGSSRISPASFAALARRTSSIPMAMPSSSMGISVAMPTAR